MKCPKCGGDIIGDGYTSVMHCEYADDEEYEHCEPDADVVLCNFEESSMLARQSAGEPFKVATRAEYTWCSVTVYKDGSVRLYNKDNLITLSFEDLQRLALEARIGKTP